MKEFEFELIFKITDEDSNPDIYMDALFEAGCDDAIVAMGKNGILSLSFIREDEDAYKALRSAIFSVKKAISNAVLIEVSPDYVGISDMAKLLGFSRQNARKIFATSSGPAPVHVGSSQLWHLSEVFDWLSNSKETKKYEINASLIEIANITKNINFAIDTTRTEYKMSNDMRELVVYKRVL